MTMKQDTQPFEKWHIKECFDYGATQEINIYLKPTEAQKQEILNRAPSDKTSKIKRDIENGDLYLAIATIKADGSAALYLPCYIPLYPNETSALVKAVENFYGKNLEEIFENAMEYTKKNDKGKGSKAVER